MSFPLRFKRGDVDDDAAAGIGRFTKTDGQDIARDSQVFNCSGEGKGIRWDNTNIAFKINEAVFIKVLRIDQCRINIGKYLKLV